MKENISVQVESKIRSGQIHVLHAPINNSHLCSISISEQIYSTNKFNLTL